MRRDNVVPPGQRVAHLAYRAEFTEWEMEVPLEWHASIVTKETLLSLLMEAGMSIGIGAWRPENDGPFGTWRLKGAERL